MTVVMLLGCSVGGGSVKAPPVPPDGAKRYLCQPGKNLGENLQMDKRTVLRTSKSSVCKFLSILERAKYFRKRFSYSLRLQIRFFFKS